MRKATLAHIDTPLTAALYAIFCEVIECILATSEAIVVDERLDELMDRLRKIARYVAAGSPTQDKDEMLQEMILAYYERAAKDRSFIDQTDGYILNWLRWCGNHAARGLRIYDRYVVELEGNSQDDDDRDPVESLQGEYPDPEMQVETMEQLSAAMSALTPENRVIVSMLFQGFKVKEVAERMGVSPAAISQRRSTIKKQIKSISLFTEVHRLEKTTQ